MRIFTLIFLLAAAGCGVAAEQTQSYQLEKHYKSARQSYPDSDSSRPDVIEIFWYGCPHCYEFDPKLEQWLANKPDDVNFARVPASLGRPIGKLHAKAYYTAELLGVLDTLHHAIFKAMHQQRKRLATPAEIEALFVANGVSTDDFRGTFDSFAVESKVAQGEMLIRALGVPAVPSMAVDNQYWTSARQAGGFDGMLKVVDHLVAESQSR